MLPGLRDPSSSAAFIMKRAALSFTLEAGFINSAFARTRFHVSLEMLLSFIRGVFPIRSKTDSANTIIPPKIVGYQYLSIKD
jgi:hypothetical protein